MMDGWIKLHRKILDWEWFDDDKTFKTFIYLLLRANHTDKKWKGMTIRRGQIVVSLESLSRDLGYSVQTLRTILKRLKSTGELTSKSTNKFTILTLENYKFYQDDNDETNKQINKQANKQLTNKQQTTNKQLTTNKNDKNDKNERIKEKEYKYICSIRVQEGEPLKLTKNQIERWQERFTLLDVKVKLQNLAEYYEYHKPCWKNAQSAFFAIPRLLEKEHNKLREEMIARGEDPDDPTGDKAAAREKEETRKRLTEIDRLIASVAASKKLK